MMDNVAEMESRRGRLPSAQQQLQQELDIKHLIEQAQIRWLKPPEICEILQNYEKYNFQLNTAAPNKPPSGSLFLFDRKTLRYYRKDGHNWRKKNDGRSVREAHERLKVGSIEMLHCYYAHGEENPDFQRRSYWMLEGGHGDIVLVHYLEVKQGGKRFSQWTDGYLGSKVLLNESQENFYQASEGLPNLPSEPEIGSESATLEQPSYQKSLQEAMELRASLANSENTRPIHSTCISSLQHDFTEEPIQVLPRHSPTLASDPLQSLDTKEVQVLLPGPGAMDQSSWNEFLNDLQGIDFSEEVKDFVKQEASSPTLGEMLGIHNDEQLGNNQPLAEPCDDFRKVMDQSSLDLQNTVTGVQIQASWENAPQAVSMVNDEKLDTQPLMLEESITGTRAESCGSDGRAYLEQLLDLDELEVASPMKFTGGSASEKVDLRISTKSSPPLSQEAKFSILDFSPDWGFSSEETKVLISGIFLTSENPLDFQWSCMFGEVEVFAEVSNVGVLVCKAPRQRPGRVQFFVSTRDKQVHSQVRHFEYRAKVEGCSNCATHSSVPCRILSEKQEEAQFQIKLVRMLFHAHGDGCEPERFRSQETNKLISRYSLYNDGIHSWDKIEGLASVKSGDDLKEKIFQMVVKAKLQDWLLIKALEGVESPPMLNESGEGLLHLVAALDYDWAISPILASGVVVNFRDRCGRTALHWAALYGREKTALALLAAGANPGAVTDPTPKFVNGCTPADLASSRGHKGLAGYLAEMSLTTHLKSLTIIENDGKEIFSIPADWEGDKAVEALSNGIQQQVLGGIDDVLSLERSLRAVRNAAQTAALIKAAFRHQDTVEIGTSNVHGLSSVDIKKLVAEQKLRKAFQAHWKKRHSAATQIQSNYRSWRRRKEFLDLRRRVIKIQAHVRGYLVRKQYKVLLWAVGILEKAILRWRRKRIGLHHFHAKSCNAMEEDLEDEDDDNSFLKEGRKQKEQLVEKAVQRVQSMVMSSEARAQYTRLLENSQQHQFDMLLQNSDFTISHLE